MIRGITRRLNKLHLGGDILLDYSDVMRSEMESVVDKTPKEMQNLQRMG